MQLRYNFRLYPTAGQITMLAKTFGCARVVFNDGIRARESARMAGLPYIKDTALQHMLTVQAKATTDRAWLSEVSADALIQSIRDMQMAYRDFFQSVSGARKGRKLGAPRYRSKRDTRQAARFTRNGFRLRRNGRLYLAKIGEVEVRWSRALPTDPSSVTVVKDSAGRYFASFVVDVGVAPLPELGTEIGLDLGLNSYAVDSSGRVIANPRFLRNHERRLRKAQKALSRKEKGSRNQRKARVKVARVHAKVADCRRNWLHQVTTRLIRDNQAVYLEDLAIVGLARTHLSKSVYDASWGAFRRMLEQKAAQYGRYVGIVGRFEPTSQTCSGCGHSDGYKPLSVRVWTCSACGVTHDRDKNAAKNILALGRRERLNACGVQVRPGAIPAPRDEAGTRRRTVATVQQESSPQGSGGRQLRRLPVPPL